MNPTDNPTFTPTIASPAQTFAGFAVRLAVAGILISVIISCIHLERAVAGFAFILAFIAEILAFICGVLGWRERAARVVVFAQLGVLALFTAAVAFYFSMRV